MIQPIPDYFVDELRTRLKNTRKLCEENRPFGLTARLSELVGRVEELEHLIEFCEAVEEMNKNSGPN